MKNELTILKIRDTEDCRVLDTFLVKNATQEKFAGLKDLIDSRNNEDLSWNDDWDYGCVYEYIYENFELVGYNEEVIDY